MRERSADLRGRRICALVGAGPGKSEDNHKDQRVRGNVQIEVGQAVQQDGDNAAKASERDGSVIAGAVFSATPKS